MSNLRPLEINEEIRYIANGIVLTRVVKQDLGEGWYRVGYRDISSTILESRECLYGKEETDRLIKDLEEVRDDAARNIERLKSQLEPSAA